MGAATTVAVAVKDGEKPWTAAELAGVTEELTDERDRLDEELAEMEAGISSLIGASANEAGDDTADSGSKSSERDRELAVAANLRRQREQVGEALDRLDQGAFGLCDKCGEPIGKLRLQAFPQATMCLACKQAADRR